MKIETKTEEFFGDKSNDVFKFHYDEEGNHVVSSFSYKERGEKLEGSDLGDLFEIIIIPQRPLKEPERFRAILISPMHYIKRLLNDGFIGFVGTATTNSTIAFDDLEEKIREHYDQFVNMKGNSK